VKKNITVDIPPGVTDGMRLRIAGGGEAGRNGGPHGDLYVDLSVSGHDVFSRRGDDILSVVTVSYTQLVFGCQIEVPGIDGHEVVTVPRATPSGKVFRLKGKGVKRVNSSYRGDQLVKVEVEIPRKLTPEQAEILKSYGATLGEEHDNKNNGLIQKIRKKIFS